MLKPEPCVLESARVRLEPLQLAHADALRAAAADGALWNLRVTSVPEPAETESYIAAALAGQDAGSMLPFAVRELATDRIVGSTRYHDVVPAVDRLEITWKSAVRRGSAVARKPLITQAWRPAQTMKQVAEPPARCRIAPAAG